MQRDIRTDIARVLLDPAAPAPRGLCDPGRATARRFAVYRNNVAAMIADTLGDSFPAVRALVGEEFFRAMALAHGRESPPRSPILHEFGGGFPDFVAAFPPAAGLPYLGDVARLEWAWLSAYHAAEAEALVLTDLAALTPEALAAFAAPAHPAARLVPSRHPIVAIWAETTGRTPPAPVDLARPEAALVTRPGGNVQVRSLSPADARFASALLSGAPLGDAFEAGLALPGFEPAAALAAIIGSGLLARPGGGELLPKLDDL